MKTAIVVDYGLGNLASVARALKHVGVEPVVSAEPGVVLKAERLIVPGVGAFGTAMRNLQERRLVDPLKTYAATGRPLFGLCLGMQLLMEESDELGRHAGLAIVPGRVARLPEDPQRRSKVPHIGWSALEPARADWNGSVLENAKPGDALYFVHSYYVLPSDPSDVVANTVYAGFRYCAVLAHGNLMGCQAHPEKSGEVGLGILANFARMALA